MIGSEELLEVSYRDVGTNLIAINDLNDRAWARVKMMNVSRVKLIVSHVFAVNISNTRKDLLKNTSSRALIDSSLFP